MVSGVCSGSSSSACYSSSSSSSATSSPAPTSLRGGGADRMVEEELEAAEALADLAHFGMRESCGGESVGVRRRKGKRVKSELLPPKPGLDLVDSVARCSDLAQDRIVSQKQDAKVCGNVLTEPLKTEDDNREKNLKVEKNTELPNTSPVGTARYSLLGCGKSRRNLTEAEKEERRIRRVLANRESARQTIRRRQALCEELTKKAADLASQNDTLKREMEMALKEYQALEITNKQLKDRMANAKADTEEIHSRHKPARVQLPPPSASPGNCSPFMYNHPPFIPLFWPAASQSENAVHASHILQNAIVMPSNIPFPAEGRHNSFEQEIPINTNGPAPFYIFPCPWFFPHPDHGVQSQPSFARKIEQDETYVSNKCGATSSKPIPHLENQHSFLPVKVKTEPSYPLEVRTNDHNEHPAEVSQDTADYQTVSRRVSVEPIIAPTPVKPMMPISTAKLENGLHDSTPHVKTSEDEFHTPSAPSGKSCEPIIYLCKKSAEAIAAAEARKRRKELTKLKNLHGRQCRMHC
ncbi:Basic-leucine zipper transcription factor [Parasponia andersonii]|uniref:Basic-leucine zipper transcription factor n=1 Tax=Parasponia andersonii TaxID=3476 RepID=A0A2P5B1Z6_PARAD|nr:Basic-leucine zipper transcription factor [Parasponia andersonii]